MTCPKCQHEKIKKFGTTGKAKIQRYRCDRGATFSPRPPAPLDYHTTPIDDASRALALMLEGMSLRAISRITGIHKGTLSRLILTAGFKCRQLLDTRVRDLRPRYVEADELWTFVAKKQKRVTAGADARSGSGDSWLWLALDAETKMVISSYVGKRNADSAHVFIGDLRKRIAADKF